MIFVVTGGSRGIGAATVLQIVAAGQPEFGRIGGFVTAGADTDEDVATRVRAVLEHCIQRHVPPADLNSRVRRGNERTGDADVVLVAGEMLGVVGTKREPEQRCQKVEPGRPIAGAEFFHEVIVTP